MNLNLKPITGSIQPRDGMLHAVINLYLNGRRKQPWIETGLAQRNGKTKAKAFLNDELAKINAARDAIMLHLIRVGVTGDAELKKQTEQRMFELVQARRTSVELFDAKLREFTSASIMLQHQTSEEITSDMLFLDFMRAWLPTTLHKKKPIDENTYTGYNHIIEGRVAEYFGKMFPYRLTQLTPDVFEDYYDWLRSLGRSSCTALHHHRLMSQALKWGVRKRKLYYNVLDQVEPPENSTFIATYYSEDEAKDLVAKAKERKDPLYIPILLATYYGLRRSEVLGLRWSSIDFKNKRISVERKIVVLKSGGKRSIEDSNRMKTHKSRRTLPLIPFVEQELLWWKALQKECFEACAGSSRYNANPTDHICTNLATGYLLYPDYVTNHFRILIRQLGMRPLRFHDLRHTCASLLVQEGFSLYQVAVWLGHSTSATTEKFYAHLDFKSQKELANAMAKILDSGDQSTNAKVAEAIARNDEQQLVCIFRGLSMEERKAFMDVLQTAMAA